MFLTAGVYSLSDFEVTPSAIIGFLTVLSYSLYDTVVVFDKIRENTTDLDTSTRRTFAEEVNLAVNQTLVRSINTMSGGHPAGWRHPVHRRRAAWAPERCATCRWRCSSASLSARPPRSSLPLRCTPGCGQANPTLVKQAKRVEERRRNEAVAV